MKRILTIVLALMLVLSCTAFVASAEAEKKLSVLTIAAGASFPDGVTVGTSDYLQKIEELTGFDLEWTNFTDASTDGLMLMMTSGNTPDLIQYASGAPLVDLANSGAIAPLNNSLEKNGQGLLGLLPQDVIDMGTIDGNIYFLPRYTGGGQLGTITIRKDVLDKLGLGIPKTIEDYDVVFQTVKEQTDLTPLMLQSGRSSFMLFASALGVDFTRNTYFYVVNDECTIPVLTEKGQAFIEKMHEWYVAGYIDPEYLMDSEVISKFLAGSGFATFLDYTQIARGLFRVPGRRVKCHVACAHVQPSVLCNHRFAAGKANGVLLAHANRLPKQPIALGDVYAAYPPRIYRKRLADSRLAVCPVQGDNYLAGRCSRVGDNNGLMPIQVGPVTHWGQFSVWKHPLPLASHDVPLLSFLCRGC
jgi:hypothetical protein